MKKIALYIFVSTLALILFALSLRTGIVQIHSSLWHLLRNHSGVDGTTVWQVRFPRALGAVIIGAGLGVAGVIAQGIFRNPLAEPTLIGLSSGATLGTIGVIASGAAALRRRWPPFGRRPLRAHYPRGAQLPASGGQAGRHQYGRFYHVYQVQSLHPLCQVCDCRRHKARGGGQNLQEPFRCGYVKRGGGKGGRDCDELDP